MKYLILIVFCFFCANSFAQSFMPENNLWKYDCLDCKSVTDQAQFEKIIDIAAEIYKPLADKNNEVIQINKLWKDSTVNANVTRKTGKVIINMYGGLARRNEVGAEGFALVLCHELGHAYGGIPYIYEAGKLSAEGIADYYGAGACLPKVLKELKLEKAYIEPTKYTEKVCSGETICLQALAAGQELGNLLAVLSGEGPVNYETPDTSVVSETELSYPNTVQCRLDSYLNGVLNLPKPKCWFAD